MKAILSKQKNNLVLELQSEDKRKVLINDDKIEEDLKIIAKKLGFIDIESMLEMACKGDETIFEFERVYDSGEGFSFEVLENYLNSMKIDKNLPEKLQGELKDFYLSDLAASSIECLYENFVYTMFDQLTQLVVTDLDIETKTFDKGHYDRLIEIIGNSAGLAEIKVSIVHEKNKK